MKLNFKALLATAFLMFFSFASYAQSSSPLKVAITVTVSLTEGCKASSKAEITPDLVRGWVSSHLTNHGYQIARSLSEASDGLESLIDVTVCGFDFGGGSFYSASVGVFGVVNAKSPAAKGNRFAFSYSSGLSSAGGDSGNNQPARLRTYVKENVETLLGKSFR